MKLSLRNGARPLIGVLCCSAAALLAAHTSLLHPWRAILPIVFVVLIVLLARLGGVVVGVVGSVITALIFAYFLFPPIGSFWVADPSERSKLAWMLLGSAVLSFLLLPPAQVGRTRHK